jgi:hypothetical protein
MLDIYEQIATFHDFKAKVAEFTWYEANVMLGYINDSAGSFINPSGS